MTYIKGIIHHGLWFLKESKCSLVGFSDSDFGGCKSDRKNTSETCNMFGNCSICWHNKKQHIVSLSTAETENVATDNYCSRVLWVKQQLLDYDLKLGCVPIKCDKASTLSLTKNLVLHSDTKHIEI
ncbi:uncharacterized mitochondrial protein AtMg00810-like [Lathyrus oleraceus]|uniref:uncharacterized mitochondrial protein AtMg00810-like n=1 Tax=Pisum sativum TaxID=3888 RepID=UPI0021D3B883|nr:uncharacterized mitochondrial protein AtMg00810-like [Pisum sativum]